jgi:hypothetical protein
MQQITKRLLSWASMLEENTEQQARTTAQMPFVFPHLALMPDAHLPDIWTTASPAGLESPCWLADATCRTPR